MQSNPRGTLWPLNSDDEVRLEYPCHPQCKNPCENLRTDFIASTALRPVTHRLRPELVVRTASAGASGCMNVLCSSLSCRSLRVSRQNERVNAMSYCNSSSLLTCADSSTVRQARVKSFAHNCIHGLAASTILMATIRWLLFVPFLPNAVFAMAQTTPRHIIARHIILLSFGFDSKTSVVSNS